MIDPAKMQTYQVELQRKNRKDGGDDGNDDSDDGSDEGINESNVKNDNLSPERVKKILEEFAPYGAKRGDLNNADSTDTGNDAISDNDNILTKKPKQTGT